MSKTSERTLGEFMIDKYEVRTVKKILVLKDRQIFDGSVIEVEIMNESAGEFLGIRQVSDSDEASFFIESEQWPHLKMLIDDLFKNHVRENEVAS